METAREMARRDNGLPPLEIDRINKLPAWAQNEIRGLRERVQALQRTLRVYQGEELGRHVMADTPQSIVGSAGAIWLPTGTRVRFYPGEPCDSDLYPRTRGIEVSIQGNRLDVRGISVLSVEMQAANCFSILERP